jgi:hypothetical protein
MDGSLREISAAGWWGEWEIVTGENQKETLRANGLSADKPKRDFSLRKPTIRQEDEWREKSSACSARNDGGCLVDENGSLL